MDSTQVDARARLLAAATAEFAQHGLSGARVDRVATSAQANKQLIYAYFGSKEGLWDAVLDSHVSGLLEVVPFNAADLADYATRLFDYYCSTPGLLRLAAWCELERPGALEALGQSVESRVRKEREVDALAAAGRISRSIDASTLIAVVLDLVRSASTRAIRSGEIDPHRAALGKTVSILVRPGAF